MKRIDKPQWKIGYNFTVDCPPAFRHREEEIKEAITKALQTWLQPLRERYPNRQFTDDFLLLKQPDFVKCGEDHRPLNELDTRITFNCALQGSAFAVRGLGSAPDVCMRTREGAGVHELFWFTLMHELGHAFGLGDTYVRGRLQSTGGLAHTIDKQLASIMSGGIDAAPFPIGEDDKNGIIWLYKYLHEDHPAEDCFFPDYVARRKGMCEPEYPLIFEAKHGSLITVEMILRDDPNLELNGRDSQGNTALHYAVQRRDGEMVRTLLAAAGLKVNLLNKDRRTPAQLARELGRVNLAILIEAHPTAKWHPLAWSIAPAHSLATTWGAIKQAR